MPCTVRPYTLLKPSCCNYKCISLLQSSSGFNELTRVSAAVSKEIQELI